MVISFSIINRHLVLSEPEKRVQITRKTKNARLQRAQSSISSIVCLSARPMAEDKISKLKKRV